MMPLMILGHLQNAGHCYSAFSHGLLELCDALWPASRYEAAAIPKIRGQVGD
jgi:hypothetical protein